MIANPAVSAVKLGKEHLKIMGLAIQILCYPNHVKVHIWLVVKKRLGIKSIQLYQSQANQQHRHLQLNQPQHRLVLLCISQQLEKEVYVNNSEIPYVIIFVLIIRKNLEKLFGANVVKASNVLMRNAFQLKPGYVPDCVHNIT